MAITLPGPLVLVGAGKMGGALLAGWFERGLDPNNVIVNDPSPPDEITALLARHGLKAVAELPGNTPPPAVLLLAVKPQIMEAVLPGIAPHFGPESMALSVAAGRTISSFEAHFGTEAAVVRSIPNTPASVGRGITACCANSHVNPEQKALCDQLLAAVGEVVWVDDEALIDPITAVSGSGPAYVFLLCEALAEAGVAAGLAPDIAMRLARATVAGAGEMLHQASESAATLRQNVTSPKGTTAAALEVLMSHDGLEPLLMRAVAAASRRSRELSS